MAYTEKVVLKGIEYYRIPFDLARYMAKDYELLITRNNTEVTSHMLLEDFKNIEYPVAVHVKGQNHGMFVNIYGSKTNKLNISSDDIMMLVKPYDELYFNVYPDNITLGLGAIGGYSSKDMADTAHTLMQSLDRFTPRKRLCYLVANLINGDLADLAVLPLGSTNIIR